jgi:hypothetical protein
MEIINIIPNPRRVHKNLDACILILFRLIVVAVKMEVTKKW